MTTYTAPVRDMFFEISELADLEGVSKLPRFEDASPDLVEAVLGEAAKFAGDILAPLNRNGDLQGSRLTEQGVEVTEGFVEAYRQFVEGGWPGLKFKPESGGQGLPCVVSTAVEEMWQSANMSFALCPLLTQGAVDAIEFHGSEEQKRLYLEKMVSGEWTGTMNLTESQAGSDLAAIRTRAEPRGDHYLIFGQKIFITWGDHDVAENIVHMVLARTPEAPAGVKGISMFIVPKFLSSPTGELGERNDLRAVSIEHKLGINASPTCVMGYGDEGGAVGYLVGEENQGLAYMFTMMNRARLSVGLQGLAIAERAYQQALRYAKDRIQGSATDQAGRVTIIHHPDVRRMLMLMKSYIEAMRATAYTASAVLDFAENAEDSETRAHYQTRVDLLTPLVKGWTTEVAQELTSLGVQIHGGMGFIEETGAAQHFRDARITTLYEGTTGIQALDLVSRKTVRDGGKAQRELIAEIRVDVEKLSVAGAPVQDLGTALTKGVDALERAVEWVLDNYLDDQCAPGSVAFDLMMLEGTVIGGWQCARAVLAALEKIAGGTSERSFYEGKLATAEFYAHHALPRAEGHLQAILGGSGPIMALSEEQF